MSLKKGRNYGGRPYPLVLTGQKGGVNCLIENGLEKKNLNCE